ncbi:hypothetical protein V6N12_064123 [Hibiscus sabdariffa]|uniref:Uncharacterized protein n=1 Tax=Hibiscus sabdariffa TaxID=183260 RepID=A0ABR2G4Y0_9ROSI
MIKCTISELLYSLICHSAKQRIRQDGILFTTHQSSPSLVLDRQVKGARHAGATGCWRRRIAADDDSSEALALTRARIGYRCVQVANQPNQLALMLI